MLSNDKYSADFKVLQTMLLNFAKVLCECWFGNTENDEFKRKIASDLSMLSSGEIFHNDAFRKLYLNVNRRILEGWYVFFNHVFTCNL